MTIGKKLAIAWAAVCVVGFVLLTALKIDYDDRKCEQLYPKLMADMRDPRNTVFWVEVGRNIGYFKSDEEYECAKKALAGSGPKK
jgi:hypothetical protein